MPSANSNSATPISASSSISWISVTVTPPVYGPTIRAVNLLVEKAGLQPRSIAPSRVLAERKEQVVKLLKTWDQTLAGRITAENFFLDRSSADWQQLIADRMAAIGRIKSIGEIEPENQMRGTFRVTGELGVIDVWFTLSPEREPKIQALELRQPQS